MVLLLAIEVCWGECSGGEAYGVEAEATFNGAAMLALHAGLGFCER